MNDGTNGFIEIIVAISLDTNTAAQQVYLQGKANLVRMVSQEFPAHQDKLDLVYMKLKPIIVLKIVSGN